MTTTATTTTASSSQQWSKLWDQSQAIHQHLLMTTHLFIMRSCLWVSLDSNRSLSRTSAGVSVGLYSKPLAYKACSITGPHQQSLVWIFPFQKLSGKNWILKKPSKNLGDVHPKPCQPQGSAAAKPSHGKPTEVSPRLVVVDLGSLYGLGNLVGNEVQGIWRGKSWRKTNENPELVE